MAGNQSQKENQSVTKEQEIIRSTFKGNETLLKGMRGIMLGLPVTEEQKQLVKDTFADERVYEVVRNRFLPELDNEAPIGGIRHKWGGLENNIVGHNPDTIYQIKRYKQDSIDMTKKGLACLKDPSSEAPDVDYHPDKYPKDELGVNLIAINNYISLVETQLTFIWLTAEEGTEQAEELKKRMEQNSSR